MEIELSNAMSLGNNEEKVKQINDQLTFLKTINSYYEQISKNISQIYEKLPKVSFYATQRSEKVFLYKDVVF